MKELILKSLQIAKGYLGSSPVADTRPRYKVEQFGNKHYMYTLNKPFLCPDVHYYRYTGNSLNSGRFKEVEACLKNGAVLFKGFIARQVT